MKNKIINYVGQLRLYSLVDLLVLLYAAQASERQFIGSVFLWLSFLFLLEYRHRHAYRLSPPKYFWVIVSAIGLFFYPTLEAVLFLLFSYLYTYKNTGRWGILAPLLGGGINRFFLIAGITGYAAALPWIVLVALTIRNLLGDLRDAGKDASEGLHTIPIVLGVKKNISYVHLAGVIATTILWWSFTDISVFLLLAIIAFQIAIYNLTPRSIVASECLKPPKIPLIRGKHQDSSPDKGRRGGVIGHSLTF